MKFQRPQRRDVSIEITPLIDVVFLLLIFFMVTSTTAREHILSIVLPEAQGEVATRNSDDIYVVVSSENFLMVNDIVLESVSKESVVQHFTESFPNHHDAKIFLGGDADARHANVVLVLDALAELGIDNVSILVREATRD
ncbi:MAG: biopolymer transporter ExbD [Gammaproteobacteria bacterium]|nr:biopolymer transporter ExbD [Gammaproteobacteria bacterium]MYF38594.1 biopolymer transporter ExbD [Gammaproteobacteria bacterium]